MDSNISIPIKNKHYTSFRVDRITLNTVLGLCGLILSTGFLLTDSSTVKYSAIILFAPKYYWAACFGLYGVLKLMQSILIVPSVIKGLISILGMLAWNYILLCLVILDVSTVTPVELALIVPLLCEAWLIAALIHVKNTYRKIS